MLVSSMLLVKRSICSRTATQAYLPSISPGSGVVGYWCMLDVFDGLSSVKCVLTVRQDSALESTAHRCRLTDLGGMIGSGLKPLEQGQCLLILP